MATSNTFLKIPKGNKQWVNGRRTYNAMAIRKRAKGSIKHYIENLRLNNTYPTKLGAPEG